MILVQAPRTRFRRPLLGIETAKQRSQVGNNAKGVNPKR